MNAPPLCSRCGDEIREEVEGFDLRQIRNSLEVLAATFHDAVTRGGRISESEAEDSLAEIAQIEDALS